MAKTTEQELNELKAWKSGLKLKSDALTTKKQLINEKMAEIHQMQKDAQLLQDELDALRGSPVA
jgi:hypothetical protein